MSISKYESSYDRTNLKLFWNDRFASIITPKKS